MQESKGIRELIDTLNFDEEQMENFLGELRNNLVKARITKNVSVIELSAKTGISESAIYQYEQKGSIRISTLVKVLMALGMRWNEVLPVIEDEKMSYGRRFEYIIRDLDAKTINLLLENARTVAAIKGKSHHKESGF